MKNITFAVAKRDSHQMHFHEVHQEIEMYYLRQGERIYFVEDRTYLLSPGSVILISSNRIHKTSSAENLPHERLLLQIHPDFLKNCEAMFPDVNLNYLLGQTAVISTLDSPYNEAIRQSFEEIARLDSEKPDGFETEIFLNTAKLLLNFHRTLSFSENRQILDSAKHQKIYEVLRYIGDNLQHITSLDMLCQHFFISKYYLCHSFKAVTGLSVMTFLNMTRVLRASAMLQDRKLTIKQIGKMVGFNSVSHFSDVFKRRVGMTPNEYRKQQNQWQESSSKGESD